MYPRSAAMLSMYLMMMAMLFRYQFAETPKTATAAIQYLSSTAGCGLPVRCIEKDDQGMCCYDCSGCTEAVCASNVQCCHNTDFDYLKDIDPSNRFRYGDYGDYSGYSYFHPDLYGFMNVDYGTRRRRRVDDGDYEDTQDNRRVAGRDEKINAQCIKLFTKTNNQNRVRESQSLTYEMISTCPTGTSHRLKELCMSNSKGPIKYLIPALHRTLVKAMMFRNMHCLKCNLGTDAPGKYSNLALTRRSQHYYDPFRSLKIDLKSDFSLFDISRIHTNDTLILSATPRFSGTKTSLRLCDQTDDMFECTNPAAPKAYAYACDIFGSNWITGIGIKVKDTATNQTYLAKNIACAYCVLGDGMAITDVATNGRKRCLLKHQVEPWLLMNSLQLTDEVDTHNGTLSITHNGPTDDMGSCELGHYYDKISATCRKILCPRHYFIHEGKCHPVFTDSVGQSYYIKVNVPIQQDDDDFYTQFGPAVVDAILQKPNFFPCNLKGTLKYDSNNNVTAVILEIFFSGTYGTLYQDVIDMVKPLFRSDHLKFTFNGLEYRIYPAEGVVFSTGDPGRLINHNQDDISVLRPKTNDDWRFNKTPHCQEPIPLTAMDFCFRVYINATDVSDQLKTLHEDYKEQIDADTVAVCIEKYDTSAVFDYSNNEISSKEDGINTEDDGTDSADDRTDSEDDGTDSEDDETDSEDGGTDLEDDEPSIDSNNEGHQNNSSERDDNSLNGTVDTDQGNSGDDGDQSGDDGESTDANPIVNPNYANLPVSEDTNIDVNLVLIIAAPGALVLMLIVVVVCRIKRNEVEELDELEVGRNVI